MKTKKKETRTTDFGFLKEAPTQRRSPLFDIGSEWYDGDRQEAESTPVEPYWEEKLRKYAEKLHERETERRKKPDAWIETVLKSGAAKDKLNAYVVLLQESPVHHLSALDALIATVRPAKRRPAMTALKLLVELFQTRLLKPEKLKPFKTRPCNALDGLSPDERDRKLVSWIFEDRLKERYRRFLDALDAMAAIDEKTKVVVMNSSLELLASNPEQEDVLLERLVNRLGDPKRKIAAKAVYQSGKLLEKHPAMKTIVAERVERLLYRPNIGSKARYYGICFLSQMILSRSDDVLARKLLDIYFPFFKMSVKSGEIESKLMSALLSGVHRAYPYCDGRSATEQHVDTIYGVVRMSNFNISVQALTLLFQIRRDEKFYGALYRKMTDSGLGDSSKQALFLNLVFKALNADDEIARVRAFAKRLLQIGRSVKPQLTCGILFLLSEVVKKKPGLLERGTSSYEEEEDDDEDDDDKAGSSWVHRRNKKTVGNYDATGRNPLYAGAERASFWELASLSRHFHPSVALFASDLLRNAPTNYPGDPLNDFTQIRFLDRFVFRNPKKNPEKGKPTTVLGRRKTYVPKGVKAIAPDSREYAEKNESQIPADEVFIHRYFRKKSLTKTDEQDSDSESVTSEDFNDFMDKMADVNEDTDFMRSIKASENTDDDDDGGSDDDSDDMEVEESSGDEVYEEEEDDVEDDEEDDDDDDEDNSVSRKRKRSENDLRDLLASADEFAELLDDNDLASGGSENRSNKDKASVKQLKWEANRGSKNKKWKRMKK